MSFSLWEAGKQMSEMSGVTDKFWPWSIKQNRSKANRVLAREGTGHSKHPLPTTQEKTLYIDITRWPTPKSD